MGRIEKTVFISYRRDLAQPWALAIHEHLTHRGYDVFFDYEGVGSGDFEAIILDNIKARAHFLVLLTPSSLERCGEPGDWLRREIETAMEARRNIVPLMLEGFDFVAPSASKYLTGELEALTRYNGLAVPGSYFSAAMDRLRQQHLNISLDTVNHPASRMATQAVNEQRAAAQAARAAETAVPTAREWFMRGLRSDNHDEQLQCFTEVVRLQPQDATAHFHRGVARLSKADYDGAELDFTEAILLKPDHRPAYYYRAYVRTTKGQDATGDFRKYLDLDVGADKRIETNAT